MSAALEFDSGIEGSGARAVRSAGCLPATGRAPLAQRPAPGPRAAAAEHRPARGDRQPAGLRPVRRNRPGPARRRPFDDRRPADTRPRRGAPTAERRIARPRGPHPVRRVEQATAGLATLALTALITALVVLALLAIAHWRAGSAPEPRMSGADIGVVAVPDGLPRSA